MLRRDHKELRSAYKDLKGFQKHSKEGQDLAARNQHPAALQAVNKALALLHGATQTPPTLNPRQHSPA